MPDKDEDPFLKEERNLIKNLATIIANYINSIKVSDFINTLGYFRKTGRN